ncbi:MAG: preprotein translocase subunit SecY [Planctomycetia bacterium]|nr:preprotein translocase subunit SecY [Planctomycetia bacterium]
MLRTFVNIFKVPELRRKILFTLIVLAICRIGFYVPIPGTHPRVIPELYGGAKTGDEGGGADYLDFVATITGGVRGPFLFALGIMPYISASIILQLLTTAVPVLEWLAEEGEQGRKKINQYTRYLAVPLCLIQAAIITQGDFYNSGWRGIESEALYRAIALMSMTAGTIFLMWLGEQIDEFGIGNGISLIIMAGIVSRLPGVINQLRTNATLSFFSGSEGELGLDQLVLLGAMFITIVVGVVLITQGQRRIPIQQAKVMRGRRIYGGQRQYLPLRVNQAGVIPIIFAVSLMFLPTLLMQWLSGTSNSAIIAAVSASLGGRGTLYILMYVTLIYLFCYFWTAIQFQPKEMANNLRDYGSFIPGMRPGRRTADYIERVMNRITFVGAGFLAAIAIIPLLVGHLGVPAVFTGFLGGTGLLIIVSVALDLVQRIEEHLIMRHYEGFLSEGRVRSRRY